MNALSVFSLTGGQPLVERICAHLGVEPGRHEERDFEDGDHKIRPLESVRGRDVYLVESLSGDRLRSVNEKLIRVLFFLGALVDAGAARVTMVAPYLCYARKDSRTKPRDPLSSRYVAALFEAVRIDRMVSLEVHNQAAFENAFRIPTEHLSAAPLLVDAFVPLIGDAPTVVVSPDAGGMKRAERFRRLLERRLGRPVGSAFVEKFRSEGVVRGGRLAGDVQGCAAIIVDDLISSGGTLARAASACREHGATVAYAGAAHGLFSAGSGPLLAGSALDRIVVLDTVAGRESPANFPWQRVDVLDSSTLLAAALHRLHTDGSMTELAEAGV
jgi:ribose-phosphate pyrophosphokinase